MSSNIKAPKKLIEVALPLDAINAAAREKSIRHGHPSTLHLWWARRPLAAARAVIFAQMVNDPGYQQGGGFRYGVSKEKAQAERERLFKIIEDLVQWENTNNEEVLERARAEIRRSWREVCELNKGHPQAAELFNPDKLPAFHDPFAGGGALPLEAQRLGLESYASDLNPVAVTINKAMIEIPPRFAGRAPVFGSAGVPPAKTSAQHKAWHSRGYLPHCDVPGLLQSITFRLADALPEEVLERLDADTENDDEKRSRIDALLDQGLGDCILNDDRCAEIVEQALLHFDGQRYRLLEWCIMPNHVHVLVETTEGWPLGNIVHSWKSYTAKAINKILGRGSTLWQADYFDRYIRDDAHLQAVRDYIRNNPVKAGLCRLPQEWPRGSAGVPPAKLPSARNAGGTPALLPGFEDWPGARGLAEDVRRYGAWMRAEAEKRIGHLYPQVTVVQEANGSYRHATVEDERAGRPRSQLTVIAWLWARTVKSPNPAFSHVDVPLASTFVLSSKVGKESWVQPVVEGDRYRFTVKVRGSAGFQPAEYEKAKSGTKLARGANFRCLLSDSPIEPNYIKAEGVAGRMSAKLMAIVAEGKQSRVYLAPSEAHESVARQAQPEWKPETALPDDPRNFWTIGYGLTKYGDLFTPRQLVALTTFSDLVGEAIAKVKADYLGARASGPQEAARMAALPENQRGLDTGGAGATAYAEAVGVYLAFTISKVANIGSSIASWMNDRGAFRETFARQAIPMVWDFAESNPFADAGGSLDAAIDKGAMSVRDLPKNGAGHAEQADAQKQRLSEGKLISTDPPYYDNIGYADLSDFFYVWLRRSLRSIYPELFATLAVPKAEELVATPYRHGGKEQAEKFFLDGMTEALHNLAMQAHPSFPVTIYYAFKQSETKNESGTSSTGWEIFLEAVLKAGFSLSGTWPVRTEGAGCMIASGTNALASSIVLVCRQRPADAPTVSRREFIRELNAAQPEALDEMTRGGVNSPVAPVDLSQAIIGPGMAIFSQYAAVLEADGTPMSVRTALQLINRFLAEDDFDHDTQFCLHWFEQQGWATGKYGDADVLARAKGTSVQGLIDAGVVESGRGELRLLRWAEYNAGWDPRNPIWESIHHLIRALNRQGEAKAGAILAAIPDKVEPIRQLAYRLYTLCERKKWAEDARAYNELITSWNGIVAASHDIGHRGEQRDIFS